MNKQALIPFALGVMTTLLFRKWKRTRDIRKCHDTILDVQKKLTGILDNADLDMEELQKEEDRFAQMIGEYEEISYEENNSFWRWLFY